MKTKLAFSVLCGGWIVILVRIWPSDRWPLLAVLSYIPSLLILCAALLNLIWINAVHKNRRHTSWLYLNWLLIVCAFLLVAVDNRQFLRSPKSSQNGFRILHWNVWGSRKGAERIASEIRRLKPAIVCLNEPILHPSKQDFPPYDRLLGGNWNKRGNGNMLILSKLPFMKSEFFGDDDLKGMYLEIPGLSLLFLDVDPDLTHFRRQSFHRLFHLLSERRWKPAIILGDLNTPAYAFSLREAFSLDYHDSYFLAGHGTGYTWAFWLPIVRIDLIYVRRDRTVFRYEAFASRLSDHRMHFIDIDLPRSPDIR